MADKQKKENFFVRTGKSIALYAKATNSELKKVSWPTRKQLINNTLIVIACVVVVGIFIFILDAIFGFGHRAIVERKAEPKVENVYEIPTGYEGFDDDFIFEEETGEIGTDLEIEATDGAEAGSEAE